MANVDDKYIVQVQHTVNSYVRRMFAYFLIHRSNDTERAEGYVLLADRHAKVNKSGFLQSMGKEH